MIYARTSKYSFFSPPLSPKSKLYASTGCSSVQLNFIKNGKLFVAPWGEAKYVIGCLPSSPSSTFMYAGYTQGVSRDEKSIQIVAFIFFFLNPLLGWGQGQSFLRTSKKTVIIVNFRSCDETSFVHREIYFSKRLGKKRKGESKKSRDLYFSLFSPDIDKRHSKRNTTSFNFRFNLQTHPTSFPSKNFRDRRTKTQPNTYPSYCIRFENERREKKKDKNTCSRKYQPTVSRL